MADRTDVTFVLPGLVQSGGVRAVFEIANRLRDSGRDAAILIPERSILSPRRSLAGVAERVAPKALLPLVQRFAPRRPVSQSWFGSSVPLIVAGAPLWKDIPPSRAIVATSWRTAQEVLRSPEVTACGVYFVQHYETWSGPARRVDATWRAFNRVVVSSEWLRQMARDRFGKNGVGLAPYGVDLATFRPGTPPGTGTVGFMHDDREWKGGADMLRALEAVRARREIRAEAFGLGTRPLPEWVRLHGRLSRGALADFYRSLDLFVSASWVESGPMTLPEAMACGVATVSTDVGNVRLWAPHGECRIVPPRDPAALASAIEGLLADADERARLAEAGRAAIQSFTWERTARDFEDALVTFGLLEERI